MIRLFGHYISKVYFLLGVVEFLVALASMPAGYFTRFGLIDNLSLHSLLVVSMVYAALVTIGMIAVGMYQRGLPFTAGLLVRIGLGFLIATMAMSLVFYALPDLFLGRGVMGLAMFFNMVGMLALRSLFFRIVGTDERKHRVLVLGTGRQAAMIEALEDYDSAFVVVGYVPVGDEESCIQIAHQLQMQGSLLDLILAHAVDELVVAPDDRRRRLPVDEILDCKMSGIAVLDLLSFFEKETSRIKLDLLHPSWIIFSSGFQLGGIPDYVKRLLDIVGAALILLVGAPLMLLVAAAIYLESGGKGPILFHQVRVGLNGRHFTVHKFRSMRTDAEADGVARWATKNDSRITRVGAFTRKTRLDELPQAFNVLRGEMSLVGPRPERPEFVRQLEKKIPYYGERHRVKPGLTGWAQLSYQYGSTDDDARNKLEYDLYYVKNASVFLDLIILLETVEVVLWGKGAH